MNPADMIRLIRENGQSAALEKESKEILEASGIPTTRCHVVSSAAEAGRIAEKIGYPVVLKLASPSLLHKSEVGGVVLNLGTPEELGAAYEQILARGMELDQDVKVTIQQMAPPGVELIAGATTDPHFGMVLMLGTGGIFTELLQDTVFRMPPLAAADAMEMIKSLRGVPLLEGYRGQEACDMKAVQDVLMRLSDLVCGNPEIKELDINPLAVYPRGALALDARIVFIQEARSKKP